MRPHKVSKEWVYDMSRTFYQSLPERPVNQPEPVLTLEAAKQLLRDEYIPLQLASALNEGSGQIHTRIQAAARIGDWVEVGNLMHELYEQHIDACAQEMVDSI
jgi:hypothetical protein